MTTHLQTNQRLLDGCTLYIGGEWKKGIETFQRFDPSSLSQCTGVYAVGNEETVADAYKYAKTAQTNWAAFTAQQRSEVLRKASDILEEHLETAANQLTADMGKAIRDARGEVLRSIAILRYYSGDALQPSGDVYPSADNSTLLLTVEEALGVICAITPWNFPFAIPTWKIAPALVYGNSVVWKPAEAASGSAVLLAEVFEAAGLPSGVLNLVTGSGSRLSKALTENEALAAITFTGSGGVGNRIRQSVADRNIKIQLELGGKNPAIVLADADLEDASLQVLRGAMYSTGQRCTATSRVYVERAVSEDFTQKIIDKVNALIVGDPYIETTEVGPLGSPEQLKSVNQFLTLAKSERVTILTNASAPDSGCFFPPMVITDVSTNSRLVTEEIFGPILVLQVVENFQEAVSHANNTEFGLSSSLFTRDLTTAMKFIKLTQSGVVHVNRETAGVEPHVPFGGLKGSSSLNREQGTAAREFFTTTKTVYIRST
jgi:aldehyde dehydrogenase (NAD+)